MAERHEQNIFLSTLPASPEQRRFALFVLVIAAAVFGLLVPIARVRMPYIPGIAPATVVPAYETARLVATLVTAGLLFALYAVDRSRAVLVLAAGYLFSGLTVIPPYALSIADNLAPFGLSFRTPEMSIWLFDIWQVVWHVVFALAVLAYALLKDNGNRIARPDLGSAAAILSSVAIVTVAIVAIAVTVVASRQVLPVLTPTGGRAEPLWRYAAMVALVLDLSALCVLWFRRQSLLDISLMMVMACLILGGSLSALISPGPFSLGYYVGRLYQLIAESFVLVIMLIEASAVYTRLAQSLAAERRERERRINEMQAVLFHLARVSELAQIVPSLIHEVNQPLAAISNYVAALQHFIRKGNLAAVGPTVEKVATQATRASGIVHRLRDFIVRGETEKKVESLPRTIEDAVALALVGTGGLDVKVKTRLDPKASEALVDRIQIEQVLFNLVRNAIEAMAASPRRDLTITTTRLNEDQIEICVADTGSGLPASVRAKLFEPFVTTKERGMGVGLSVCRVVVEAHGGKLDVEENPEGGATFCFTVPAGPMAAEEMVEVRGASGEALAAPSAATRSADNAPFPNS